MKPAGGHQAIEAQYYFPRFTVGVINFGQEFMGSAWRTVAESMSCATRHYYPGTSRDLLLAIGSTDYEQMTVLSGHGTTQGVCFSDSKRPVPWGARLTAGNTSCAEKGRSYPKVDPYAGCHSE